MHTHNLFFAPLFADNCDAKRLSLSLQDVEDFDVSVYTDHLDPAEHDSTDWYLIDRSTGKVVACSPAPTLVD
jgi:hypothetical protein